MKKISLNDLDRTQSEVLRAEPNTNNDVGCWNCKHSPDGESCAHKINDEKIIGDSRAFYGVPSLIFEHLMANDIYVQSSDNGVGAYCKLFESED